MGGWEGKEMDVPDVPRMSRFPCLSCHTGMGLGERLLTLVPLLGIAPVFWINELPVDAP